MMRKISLLCLSLGFSILPLYSQSYSDYKDLWNGKDFQDWELITNPVVDIQSVCSTGPDSVLTVTGKPIGYLETKQPYKNYRLHMEYRWLTDTIKNSNSGVLVHISTGPIDRNTWPCCFQIQTKYTRVGDLLPMAGARFAETLSTPPDAKTPILERRNQDSEKPMGEWNSVDINCDSGVIECKVNGILQNSVTSCEPQSGKIGMQLEGMPYQVRHMWLTILD